MDEELFDKAERFARTRGAAVGELLGFGIHGIVVVVKGEAESAATALKLHSSREPYWRERDCYERLQECEYLQPLDLKAPAKRCDRIVLSHCEANHKQP